MCILFLWTSTDPSQSEYRVILGANRDENYSRPSTVAHFWGPDETIVGGQDAEPGKEGGTWLGMSKTKGKIAALLNMPPKPQPPQESRKAKLGRGFLVPTYLKEDLTGIENAERLREERAAERYHSFNLLTLDLNTCGSNSNNNSSKGNEPEIYYFSNYSVIGDAEHWGVKLRSDQVHSFGNCSYNAPFLKVTDGQLKFERLLETHNDLNKEIDLVEGILKILKSTDRHYPDPAMSQLVTARSREFAEGISSRFVHIPWKNYGSRTHTIILVDHWNRVKYMEWTMMEPILDPLNSPWIETIHEFCLQDNDD